MRKQVIIRDFKLAIIALFMGFGLTLVTNFPIETALGIPVGIMLASFVYELAR